MSPPAHEREAVVCDRLPIHVPGVCPPEGPRRCPFCGEVAQKDARGRWFCIGALVKRAYPNGVPNADDVLKSLKPEGGSRG